MKILTYEEEILEVAYVNSGRCLECGSTRSVYHTERRAFASCGCSNQEFTTLEPGDILGEIGLSRAAKKHDRSKWRKRAVMACNAMLRKEYEKHVAVWRGEGYYIPLYKNAGTIEWVKMRSAHVTNRNRYWKSLPDWIVHK